MILDFRTSLIFKLISKYCALKNKALGEYLTVTGYSIKTNNSAISILASARRILRDVLALLFHPYATGNYILSYNVSYLLKYQPSCLMKLTEGADMTQSHVLVQFTTLSLGDTEEMWCSIFPDFKLSIESNFNV